MSLIEPFNLLGAVPGDLTEEVFETLLSRPGIRLDADEDWRRRLIRRRDARSDARRKPPAVVIARNHRQEHRATTGSGGRSGRIGAFGGH